MKFLHLQELIYANHILHNQNVVDAYGHVSLRHPDNPNVFIMSASKAPALVSAVSDLIHYNISDSSPVDPNAKMGYQERFIHGEIYKRFANVNCVIHSHAESVIPYTSSAVRLRPVYHMAGFLGESAPVFDITEVYKSGERQDFLVNSERFGSALAEKFSNEGSSSQDHNVVVMAHHGFTTLGSSIRQAVYRAVYTQINAGLLTNTYLLSGATNCDMTLLNRNQASDSEKTNDGTAERPWQLWVREVDLNSLYQNEALNTDPLQEI